MLQTKPQPSLKTRWLIWRARFSIPSLLARCDERQVISIVTAINGGLSVLIISLLSWFSNAPLLFPALGPTAFILFHSPLSESAAPRSVITGHLIGMVSGFTVWRIASYFAGGNISLQTGGYLLLCSATLALAISCFLLVWFSCPHPPACASALIIALGGVTTWVGILCMAAAVVLMTAQAVTFNRISCLPVPLWWPRDQQTG